MKRKRKEKKKEEIVVKDINFHLTRQPDLPILDPSTAGDIVLVLELRFSNGEIHCFSFGGDMMGNLIDRLEALKASDEEGASLGISSTDVFRHDFFESIYSKMNPDSDNQQDIHVSEKDLMDVYAKRLVKALAENDNNK